MRLSSIIACAAGLSLALSLGGTALADDTASSAQAPNAATSRSTGMTNTGSVNRNLGKGPAEQHSLPSHASKATTKKHTGATNQSPTVKSMNKEAGERIQVEGK
jgi:hypothetical protein